MNYTNATGICPNCKKQKLFIGKDEVLNAVSQEDNKTYICSDCGQNEGIANYYKFNMTLEEKLAEDL